MRFAYSGLASSLEKRVEPVYLLVGDQDLLRELAAKKLQSAVVGEDPSPFAFERFDGESGDSSNMVMAANMMPLLGGRRFVLVKRASRLVESDAVLQAYLEDPNPNTVLVLDLEKKPDGRRKGWKDLEKIVIIVACDAPDPWELQDWVSEEGNARGLKLGREEVRYLVSEVGSDLRRLASELEKLSLYAAPSGKARMDLETMKEVLGRGRAQSVFKLTDAVASGDAPSAIRQLGRLLEEGEAPLRILALLDRLVGQLRIAKDALASGRKDSSLASLLGAPPPAARAIAERARRVDRDFLTRAVEALADADRLLKSTRLPHQVVMEGLVLELARGSRR